MKGITVFPKKTTGQSILCPMLFAQVQSAREIVNSRRCERWQQKHWKGAVNRGNKTGALVLYNIYNIYVFKLCVCSQLLWVHCTYKIIKCINSWLNMRLFVCFQFKKLSLKCAEGGIVFVISGRCVCVCKFSPQKRGKIILCHYNSEWFEVLGTCLTVFMLVCLCVSSIKAPAARVSSGNQTTARYCCSAGWHWPRRLPLGRWTQMKMCMRCCSQWPHRHGYHHHCHWS